MAIIQFRDLNFTYPTGMRKALEGISFDVQKSEFIVICGKSGCGKSTLLRHMKKNMTPYGTTSGQVLYDGIPMDKTEARKDASEIGFVQQNPDNQLVTDKVWHELAFGLESLGVDTQTIKRRVAEMASFFDIQTWFRKDVSELSGGQKQLLNLASIMVMQPKVLILDEPTSQLDPIAAAEFLKTVYRINRDIGTTVIISEHRLEDLFPMADRIMVLEDGKIAAWDTPWNIGKILAGDGKKPPNPMFYGMPAVMKLYASSRSNNLSGFIRNDKEFFPLTVRDGRIWLESILGDSEKNDSRKQQVEHTSKLDKSDRSHKTNEGVKEGEAAKEEAIRMNHVSFRYSRDGEEILRDLDLTVNKGEIFCLLGGNGVGKTTTLKAISGIIKPQKGTITVDGIKVQKENLKKLFQGKLAMVPQNPQALFTEITVEDELLEALYYIDISLQMKSEKVEEILRTMEIEHLRKSHPYDLSGGEQQRLAIGKILLLDPKIILLDEPTKGLDPFFKISLAGIFRKLKEKGITVFMVSHDIEFCAEYADRCAMFFDGSIVSEGKPIDFFAGNSFYTTAANRIARQWFPDAITWEEVGRCLERTIVESDKEP